MGDLLMNTFITSDTHFSHDGVLQMSARPFASIEEHDDVLLDAINRTVGPDDRLYHLGDFAWSGEASLFARIKCRNIHLIVGNHDRGRAIKLFKTVADTSIVKLGEHKVFLSHYPHAYWPASHYGSLHLYGHQHGQREATLDACFPGRRSMDVGVDEAKRLLGEYRPFNQGEILDILLKRPGHDDVQWYKDYQAAGMAWLASR